LVIADAHERRARGLDFWVDGTMGFHRVEGRTLVLAPNGPALSRFCVDDATLLDGLVASQEGILDLPPGVEHASGGPLVVDPTSGRIVLVYHGETFHEGDPSDFYSFLGMASAEGPGAPFRDLGRIITSDVADDDPTRQRPVELGPGGCLLRDGWLLVYFLDRHRWGVRRHLSVARARIEDVFDAAAQGRPPVFQTYDGRGWGEPGLGGRAVDLLASTPFPVMWFDVAWLAQVDAAVCVFSTVNWEVSSWRWTHAVTTSVDGLRWSTPRLLYPTPLDGEALYVSIDSAGSSPRTVDGDTFDLYRVRATATFRWDDAVVERLSVRVTR
jgi:hypothetical protein